MGGNDDQRFQHDDDRYSRTDRQIPRASYDHDDGRFRQSDQYGQGQSGYTSGRTQGDPSLGFQARNQGYGGNYDEQQRPGDERWSGRGGSAYWQPPQGGYSADRGGNPVSQGAQSPNQGSRRRHQVGNYGYGSDSYSTTGGGSMFDQNQGVGQQGHFGGSPGGYGHVGSYGSEGGAQNHGPQGWQGNQGWDGQAGSGQAGARTGGGHRGKGPKNFQRSDERIREAVSEALEIHDDLDATHIDVLVQAGEVTLSGAVDDRNAKRLAEDVAASVSGVRDVQNQLRVGGERVTSAQKDTLSTDPKKARA